MYDHDVIKWGFAHLLDLTSTVVDVGDVEALAFFLEVASALNRQAIRARRLSQPLDKISLLPMSSLQDRTVARVKPWALGAVPEEISG